MADAVEPSDLGSWLASLGAPDSLTGILPKEFREIDISSVVKLLATVNTLPPNTLNIESPSDQTSMFRERLEIRWLPIVLDSDSS